MAGSDPARRGVWEPLPRFIYGYAVHPLSPSRRDTRMSNQTRLSTYTDASRDEHLVHRDVVSLEVGDEVYAFERYTPRDKEVEGVWYRGYVVCTSRRPQVTWFTSTEASTSAAKAPAKVDEAQQVFIGIFPASHIFIRDELSDAEGRLEELAATWASNPNGGTAVADLYAQWNRDRDMLDSVRGDDDDAADTVSLAPSVAARKSNFKLNPPPDQATSTRARLPVYPPSVRSASPTPTEMQVQKPLPPRPSLRPSDETVAGAEQPIIDEISSALREWHLLMFQYLARRDYKLFEVIRAHIEALHLGRRQLLAQTLSAEETVTLRRQCVARLVTANLIQGLDVIVRHPTWGGLVTVDVEGELDPRSWLSAVRMYAMQVSLAYMDVSSSSPTEIPGLAASIDYVPLNSPLPTPASSSFSDMPRLMRGQSKALGSLGRTPSSQPARAKFFHVFLDMRAFVASFCAPGETAELIFSLYDKNASAFVSEDFCAILNHNGVLARDPTSRVRTLFTDLIPQDAQHSIYLVCSIVRNGSMTMGNGMGTIQEGGKRSSELSLRETTSSLGHGWTESIDNGRTEQSSQFRRPFGCAVLELSQLRKMEAEGIEVSSTREFTVPIYVPKDEATFSMLHQDVLNGHSREYEKSARAESLAVSIKIFYGDADTIRRENSSLLQDTPLTQRLGFPDVVFPGDVRNELYIKLWSGDFSPSKTSSARISVVSFPRPGTVTSNVQVSVEVRNQEGKVVGNVITRCSGEPAVSQYNSMVFQRTSQPTFNELIRVALPRDGAQQWHLFFTFRQRNTRERSGRGSDAQERPFAFAFIPLFPDGRAFLEDGEHKLALYKADRLSQVSPDQYLAAAPCVLMNQRPEQLSVPVEMQRVAPLLRDSFIIRSSLCSTRFTQNSVLLSLLNWQSIQDKDFLSTILTKFTFVGEVEIVKYLRDIFDSLFQILVSAFNQNGEIDHLVFDGLVTMLGIVQDRRFTNFQPVLDVYIERHFSCTTAYSHMIRSMNRLLEDPTANETASALRAALKVWHYIFKFITRSRELQKEKLGMSAGATAEHLEASFQKEIRTHLDEVNRMMARSAPASIIGTQTIALQYFTSILPELRKVFSVVDLVGFATKFANSVIATKGKIIIWKLIMYLQIVRGFLFDLPQARPLLVESVVIWIKPHFGRFEEYLQTSPGDSEDARNAARVAWLENIRLSVTVIAVMLDKLQQNLVCPTILSDRALFRQEQDNVELVLILFPKLLDSYLEFLSPANLNAIANVSSPSGTISAIPVTFPESYPFALLSALPKSNTSTSSADAKTTYNAGLGETAIVILALALSSTRKHFLTSLENTLEIEGREHLSTQLTRLFRVARSILNNDAFPDNWLNVNILAHKVLLKIMDPVASILEREFIPTEQSDFEFDHTLWREGFSVLLKLLSSEQLVIEEFSPQKRRAVWRLAGDIRGEGAAILLRLWNSLGWQTDESAENSAIARVGHFQIELSPLVGQVVNLCLSIHDQLRNNAVQILYCMIVSEFTVSGHFSEIENELVSTLDTLFMSDSKGDDISRAFFIGQLRHLFESSEVDPELRTQLTAFLGAVDSFLDLLLSVRALPEGEEFADDRVIATLRLMNFIRRIGRDEIYIKYVHQLVNMHLQSQNFVEAALTLKLHADLHDWDLHSFAPPMEDLGLPQQSQFHRKETLCLLILDYLGKGKAWESALEICKDLAYQHAEVTFNYARLAEILRHQAALLEHIVTMQRYYPDYFRVAFYGNFPMAIRNKHFVYRGYEWEKFGAFCERMLNKHPGAQLLKTMGDPAPDVRFGTDQYIQCTALSPEPDRDLSIFTNPEVPPQIRTYYEHSAINLFSYSRTVTKYGQDGSEEQWVEKTYLRTEETFPTVLRRSEVVEVTVVEISPIESALQIIEERTRDLRGLSQKYATLAQTAGAVSTTPLSMALNSAVDAPHNDGVAHFRQVFLSGDYLARYPDRAEQAEKLRAAIDEQVHVLDACLRLHGQLCPQEMEAFHNTLLTFFKKNFSEEIRRLALGAQSLDSSLSGSIKQPAQPAQPAPSASHHSSLLEQRSTESTGTARQQFSITPLDLGRAFTSASVSPPSSRENGQSPVETTLSSKQTPLQRGLAHLARHGFNGVASGPRDNGDGDMSEESPRDSFVNGSGPMVAHLSGAASVTTSTVGGSTFRGRFSKFGSLNFARRDN